MSDDMPQHRAEPQPRDEPQPRSGAEPVGESAHSAAQGDADGREWIAVPPPHPHAAAAPSPGSRGIAIVGMAVGLAGLLTVVVSALYFDAFFMILGAVIGALAVVFGIVALVKRGRPKAAGITGVVAGALAILLPIGVLTVASAQLVGERVGDLAAESWSPDETAEPEVLLEWPANMSTGGVIFEPGGDSGPTVRASDPIAPGGAPETPVVDRGDEIADIVLYVDFRCPHCLHFEAANGAFLADLVASGQATLEIVPLSFVDAEYSAPLAGAFACVADGQPAAAWDAFAALFDEVAQLAQPDADAVARAVHTATGGLDPEVQDCIRTGRFTPFMAALDTWVLSTPVPNAVDADLRVSGTPTAVVEGVPYPGAPDDAAAFAQFFAEQTR